jgi:hypothetical protein
MVTLDADQAMDDVTRVAYIYAEEAARGMIARWAVSVSHRLHVVFCCWKRNTVSSGYWIYGIFVRYRAPTDVRSVWAKHVNIVVGNKLVVVRSSLSDDSIEAL